MTVGDIEKILDEVAPPTLAESWDNVGLLIGDRSRDVQAAMFCIDYTHAVADEAKAQGCALVIAYHPPLFHPLRRILAGEATGLVYRAIADGIAIYSPHTAWDAVDGGTNDVLADVLGLKNRTPLRLSASVAKPQYKLVTFVPAEQLEKISAALFEAGAGRIGDYSSCSFQSEGTGTFFGETGTSPAAGEAGKMQRVPELKIETIVAEDRLDAVVAALKKSHPYETPAFDLVLLSAPPAGNGPGRVGDFSAPIARELAIEIIKTKLGLSQVMVAGPTSGDISRAAVCAGAGDDLLDDAIAKSAQLYLTGELRHHEALKAAAAGVTAVCTLHSLSERPTLMALLPKFQERMPAVRLVVSQEDRDPYRIR